MNRADAPRVFHIGIDLGGTKIAAGLVDICTGTLTHRRRQPTPVARDPATVVRSVAGIASAIMASARADGIAATAVGIAVPELVDLAGQVCSSWNFNIATIRADVCGLLGGLPVMTDSDVRAAARAEARLGAGASHASFVYLSLGTGMSYSLVINGQPWPGANGFAIHFASSALALPKADDTGLTLANAEDFASGRGMQESFFERTGKFPENGVLTLEQLGRNGNPVARRILEEAGEVAGRLVAQMVNMLDPGAVVLGGGLGCSGGRYRKKLEHVMRGNIWARRCRSLPLYPAMLGEDAGIVGAALAVPSTREQEKGGGEA